MSFNEQSSNRQNISYGRVISQKIFMAEKLFPDELKEAIAKTDYYLLVFIPDEKQGKLNILPVKNDNIKKILVKLETFSPELVKGISEVLNQLKLNDCLIHTSGLCFSHNQGCFYETYVDLSNIKNQKTLENEIKEKFIKFSKVLDVKILEVSK